MSTEKTATREAMRVFNKHVLNPVMLMAAGRGGFYASVINHTGRRSGRHYHTPVVAERVADGFVVPLIYGEHVDWLQNLRVHGSGTMRHAGRTYTVEMPIVVDAATAEAELPPRRRRVFERFGVKSFVHLNLASADVSSDDRAGN
jgi:deazaflavin-dependent oxidoreductase (nitroreductase family)